MNEDACLLSTRVASTCEQTNLPELVNLLHCELFGAKQSIALLRAERQMVGCVCIFVRVNDLTNVRQGLVLDSI